MPISPNADTLIAENTPNSNAGLYGFEMLDDGGTLKQSPAYIPGFRFFPYANLADFIADVGNITPRAGDYVQIGDGWALEYSSGATVIPGLNDWQPRGDTACLAQFGVVGDDTTDDTAAVQAAFDWSSSTGGGIAPCKLDAVSISLITGQAGVHGDLRGVTFQSRDATSGFDLAKSTDLANLKYKVTAATHTAPAVFIGARAGATIADSVVLRDPDFEGYVVDTSDTNRYSKFLEIDATGTGNSGNPGATSGVKIIGGIIRKALDVAVLTPHTSGALQDFRMEGTTVNDFVRGITASRSSTSEAIAGHYYDMLWQTKGAHNNYQYVFNHQGDGCEFHGRIVDWGQSTAKTNQAAAGADHEGAHTIFSPPGGRNHSTVRANPQHLKDTCDSDRRNLVVSASSTYQNLGQGRITSFDPLFGPYLDNLHRADVDHPNVTATSDGTQSTTDWGRIFNKPSVNRFDIDWTAATNLTITIPFGLTAGTPDQENTFQAAGIEFADGFAPDTILVEKDTTGAGNWVAIGDTRPGCTEFYHAPSSAVSGVLYGLRFVMTNASARTISVRRICASISTLNSGFGA